jgi:hypothetical protein
MTKRRISASIDPDLLSAAEAAVKRRCSSNFSASFRPNEKWAELFGNLFAKGE